MPVSRSTSDADVPLVLVDDGGRPLGISPKFEAHVRGLKHLAISVVVANREGELLMQQRAPGKYHSGGLWTNTCCSHPYPGEAVDAAAYRRLGEEMGIACALQPMFATAYRAQLANGLIENEFVHVFGGICDRDPAPDPREVVAWRWQSLGDIRQDLKSRPDAYSAWFEIYINNYASSFIELTRGSARQS